MLKRKNPLLVYLKMRKIAVKKRATKKRIRNGGEDASERKSNKKITHALKSIG